MGKRKDNARSCEKCRHLERGTQVTDGRIPQRRGWDGLYMCKGDIKMRPREIYYSTFKATSRQTKDEMARLGERGCGQKPDDDRDDRIHWYVMMIQGYEV